MKTKEEIISLNEKQAEFYNHTQKKNWITGVWSKIRNNSLGKIRKDLGIQEQIYTTHKQWLGDLSNKKVLDLGCYEGNALSLYLAESSKEYLGIDLSVKGIETLSRKLEHLPSAKAEVIDFLSDDFIHRDFDVIYAYGVMHHFENLQVLIDTLNKVMATNAQLITYDPLKTSFPIKVIRTLYRPFQTDADWEWPFSKAVVHKLEADFKLLERRAVLGRSKYVAILNLLPYPYTRKLAKGKQWHKKDWERSSTSDKDVFRSMHITMHLQKK